MNKAQISVVNLIRNIIVVAVVLLAAVVILGPVLRASGASLCSFSVTLRNNWERFKLFGLVRAADVSNFHLPLFGCGVSKRETRGIEETTSTITEEVGGCWRTYGAGEYDALVGGNENPARCSSITAHLEGNLTPKNITDAFKNVTYSKKLDCRVGEDCCPEGCRCYKEEPRFCINKTANVFKCISEPTVEEYVPCPPNYRLEETTIEEGYGLFPRLSCKPEGCYYNTSQNQCVWKYNNSNCGVEPRLPSPFVNKDRFKFCNATSATPEEVEEYDIDRYKLPEDCTLKRQTKGKCKNSTSLYSYLKPGKRTLYSFSWRENGERHKSLTALDKESANANFPKVSGETHIVVNFMDVFTHIRKAPEIRELPGECAAGTFVDSMKGCGTYCERLAASAVIGTIASKAVVSSSVLKIAGGAAVLGGTSGTSAVGSTWETAKFWTKTAKTATGAQQCWKCITNKFLTQADLSPIGDSIIICVYEK